MTPPRERILVAVAWPYANGPLHLGHVAGSLLAPDIFRRFHKLRGSDVVMVSGSDMHGTPITVRAEKEGMTPEALAAKYNRVHIENLAALSIEFDLFTSTATANHAAVVHDVFRTLVAEGAVYAKTMVSPYDPKAERFLLDRYVEGTCPHCGFADARGDQCDNCGKILDPQDLGNPRSKLTGVAPEYRETEHYFLRLSAFEDRLKAWIEGREGWRANTVNFTQNWLAEGLKDRPITRDLEYGVAIPEAGWEKKRIYVWFEAVIGYLSATKEWAAKSGDPDAWKRFWLDPATKSYYFLGKDNVPFHTIIWPAMLMGYSDGQGARYNLPHDVPANEYLNFAGAKFSKSRGVLIEVKDVVPKFQADAVRYYLTVNMPEGRDASWTWDDFQAKVNDELLGTYGNLVNRVLSFTRKHHAAVPGAGALEASDRAMVDAIAATHATVTAHLAGCEFKKALREVMALAQKGNQYVDETAPWKLAKTDPARLATVLHVQLRLVRALAVLTAPFLPASASTVWTTLGERGDVKNARWDDALADIPAGQALGTPAPLFRRIETTDLPTEESKPMTQTPAPAAAPAAKPTVTIDDFAKLDLRVGLVTSVENHPKADKLYVLKVDLGTETRQILAGLRQHVKPEQLLGKKVVVIANLAPREIRGLQSQGMVLAAESGDLVAPLTPAGEIPPGAGVR
ncbi:MAG TPA: methionine--tRNA ligase [Candidatus Thermoplasmatota archaeon]|nr:methionine--tRNA ligase [Candidatus Thermoplasmatota archaeon]